ncbi:hypothetical protein ACH42_04700 [Endozoicomonas sp. (ex Bugula neritina AB1)]|nr:hypothetical protein ACH42_04700 [Endozoicomonas sp. (ex Bugula neritina AB1)]
MKNKAKKWITMSALTLVSTVFSVSSFAADIDINADDNDVALHGFDVVSYFTGDRPVEGSFDYTATYKNAIFKFSSAQNRDTFRADPDRYTPQYGGYCAFGTKVEKKLDIDPNAWRIENGKLYLNKDKNVQRIWVKDVPGNIQEANVAWPKIKDVEAAEL